MYYVQSSLLPRTTIINHSRVALDHTNGEKKTKIIPGWGFTSSKTNGISHQRRVNENTAYTLRKGSAGYRSTSGGVIFIHICPKLPAPPPPHQFSPPPPTIESKKNDHTGKATVQYNLDPVQDDHAPPVCIIGKRSVRN
jgi:LysM repeat protein